MLPLRNYYCVRTRLASSSSTSSSLGALTTIPAASRHDESSTMLPPLLLPSMQDNACRPSQISPAHSNNNCALTTSNEDKVTAQAVAFQQLLLNLRRLQFTNSIKLRLSWTRQQNEIVQRRTHNNNNEKNKNKIISLLLLLLLSSVVVVVVLF